MTRDELRKYVLETLAPSLEKAFRECDNLTACVEKSRQEIEQGREARRTSDKENEDPQEGIFTNASPDLYPSLPIMRI